MVFPSVTGFFILSCPGIAIIISHWQQGNEPNVSTRVYYMKVESKVPRVPEKVPIGGYKVDIRWIFGGNFRTIEDNDSARRDCLLISS